MFRKKRRAEKYELIRSKTLPQHVAIIMDGNGRWARKRNLPRALGHRAGMDAINRCLKSLKGLDVKYLTLYAFSTENWRRPQAEVDFLMNLPGQFIAKELANMMAGNIRINMIGDYLGLPEHTRASIDKGVQATAANSGLTLTFALNYGGQQEILQAARNLALTCMAGGLEPAAIDAEAFEQQLDTAGMPPVDLLIRTSGELRISNFLLWQAAYAELLFVETLWPDFDELVLYNAIAEYQRRQRRFGGI